MDDGYGLPLKDCVEKHAGIFKSRSKLGSMFASYLKDNKDEKIEYRKCTSNTQRNKMKADWAKEEYDKLGKFTDEQNESRLVN